MRNEDIIDFEQDDLENFEIYSKVTSKELYYSIAYYIKQNYKSSLFYANEKVKYKIVNDFVRLDKSIKNITYKFLSTYEEWIKTIILDKYNIVVDEQEKEYILKIEERKSLELNLETMKVLNNWAKYFKKSKGYYTDGYSHNILSFIGIKENNFNLKDFTDYDVNYFSTDLKEIVELRNKVMHHGILLETDWDKLKILYLNLPENWDDEFQKQIFASVRKRKNIPIEAIKKMEKNIDQWEKHK
ncbi:hypothetical protein [Spiroplasma floricola]|uniref:Uncharacterized protein n=1 Tax=Spiroplasma floricola 23-6 TaxID=1336749 RepID=A0A2K8SE96_9MOLU|nr:hypothetical protein [Spiroplasma floricola]AUB31769.1 hypothetical protein SFLOR_v1c07210 [Spiroplasma floricola 23-6]